MDRLDMFILWACHAMAAGTDMVMPHAPFYLFSWSLGASPGGVPCFLWATLVNPAFGPVLWIAAIAAIPGPGHPNPALASSGGAVQAIPCGVVLEVAGQVHHLVLVVHIVLVLVVHHTGSHWSK